MIGKRTLGIALATAALALLAAGAALAQGGNRIALRAMLGASVQQQFAVGGSTEYLKWSSGVPSVVQAGDLAAGDWVVLAVRAPRGASLDALEQRAAGVVSDRGTQPSPPSKPLYLYRGRLVSGGDGSVTVDVRGGNRRGLRLLVDRGARQTFAAGQETIFLRWQGKVPTVISASDLKAGDRVTVRIRAAARSTLEQVESSTAVHVGEHEPASTTVTS